MLGIVRKVQRTAVTNQSMPPSQFQEEVIVRFKQMDNSEAVNAWLPRFFLNHDVGGLTPSRNRNPSGNNNIHGVDKAVEKNRILDQCPVVAEVTTTWRCRCLLFQPWKPQRRSFNEISVYWQIMLISSPSLY